MKTGIEQVVSVFNPLIISGLLAKYGARKQLDQCQEECCEFAAEISRERRGRVDAYPPKELGDVLMTIAQAIEVYGVDRCLDACMDSQNKAAKLLSLENKDCMEKED